MLFLELTKKAGDRKEKAKREKDRGNTLNIIKPLKIGQYSAGFSA
ncbi:hypothetical protein [Bacillus altitudinis]|nr:hypothetical protein [Bacillus altitudinis]MEC1144129.1 hypothetical protein [Bacillus altitudinis]